MANPKKSLAIFLDDFYQKYPWIRIRALFYKAKCQQSTVRVQESRGKDPRRSCRDMDDKNCYLSPKWGDWMC